MDGQSEHHDFAVCREGTYDKAIEGIRMAVEMGFRVTTNTTLFDGANPAEVRQFFDEMAELGVEGMMVSPGYSYTKAPDQGSFLHREKTHTLFRTILSNRSKKWNFNQSPLFLQFLMGKHGKLQGVNGDAVVHFHVADYAPPRHNFLDIDTGTEDESESSGRVDREMATVSRRA